MTREEAISKLRGLVASCPLKHDEWQAVEVAIEALKERPHGEWCRKMYDAWECSYCHKVEYTQDIASYHYCRHCGAKMVEVTHDTSR